MEQLHQTLELLERDTATAEYNEHTARQVLMEAVMRRLEADARLRRYLMHNPPKAQG